MYDGIKLLCTRYYIANAGKYESGLYVLKKRALLEIHPGPVLQIKICLSKSTNFIDKNKNEQESTRL